MSSKAEVLKIEDLTVEVSDKSVVDHVSMTVEPGRITALLGPNGAGKSELVLAVVGFLPKKSGAVVLGRQDLTRLKPQRIRALGLAAIPEGHQVLTGLTVKDNLHAAGAMLTIADLRVEIDRVLTIFPELRPLTSQSAGSLSGGQQQMLALGQALVCRPKILLIDEMSLGLAPVVIERLIEVLRQLKSEGLGILLIEQFTHLALELADHAMVISRGNIRYNGVPEILKSETDILQNAYLGGDRNSNN